MDIPLRLRAKFANLTADESAELKTFFANLPNQDLEIQHLIEDNLDTLIEIVLDKSFTLQTGSWLGQVETQKTPAHVSHRWSDRPNRKTASQRQRRNNPVVTLAG